MDKLGIVGSGGGLACVYSAGFLNGFVKKYKIKNPDIVVATSGSTGNFAYYLAGQYHLAHRVWVELLSSESGFIDKKRFFKGNMMDLDYLIEIVFRKIEPLNVEALKNHKTNLYIAVTDYETGEAKYFSNRDNVDIFQVLKASKAAPVVYNHTIIINGRRYIDGDIGSSLEAKVDKALSEGAEKIIVIDNNQEFSKLNKFMFRRYIRKVPKKLAETIETYLETLYIQRKDPKVFYIKPSQKLPIGMLENNKENLNKTFIIGYQDAVDNIGLKRFLSESEK